MVEITDSLYYSISRLMEMYRPGVGRAKELRMELRPACPRSGGTTVCRAGTNSVWVAVGAPIEAGAWSRGQQDGRSVGVKGRRLEAAQADSRGVALRSGLAQEQRWSDQGAGAAEQRRWTANS